MKKEWVTHPIFFKKIIKVLNQLCSASLMITLSNSTKGLALLHQVVEIYGKVYTSDSLLEMVLYWQLNCTQLLKKIIKVLMVNGYISLLILFTIHISA